MYVLEGTIVMQVKGGNETRLSAGETFYESPADIHTVSRNASDTERAKVPGVLRDGSWRTRINARGRLSAPRRGSTH